MQNLLPIVCLMGPTASGKTDLAIALSDSLPLDIISVDSAMVYRGMDIGTAKPDKALLAKYPHYLIDIQDPSEPFSAALFCDLALKQIEKTVANNRIPFLVGGTMLYFSALQKGLSSLPAADAEIRKALDKEAMLLGWHAMHARLSDIDKQAAARIQPNDAQRIQRALEVYAITGQTLTELSVKREASNAFRFLNLALLPSDRHNLHLQIERRFQGIMDAGFLAEAQALFLRADLSRDLPAMRSVGYRQAFAYFAKEISFEEMVAQSLSATRQLAKRQMTWLRSWENVRAFDPWEGDILSCSLESIQSFLEI